MSVEIPRHDLQSALCALGLVALPQAWMFQIFLTALAPIADLMLVWQLFAPVDRLCPSTARKFYNPVW